MSPRCWAFIFWLPFAAIAAFFFNLSPEIGFGRSIALGTILTPGFGLAAFYRIFERRIYPYWRSFQREQAYASTLDDLIAGGSVRTSNDAKIALGVAKDQMKRTENELGQKELGAYRQWVLWNVIPVFSLVSFLFSFILDDLKDEFRKASRRS